MFGRAGTYGRCCVAVTALLSSVASAAQLTPAITMPPELDATYVRLCEAMVQDLLDHRDCRKHITLMDRKPEVTVVMGFDAMVPTKGPGAGKQVTRPFTDIRAKRGDAWQLIARQATIADMR